MEASPFPIPSPPAGTAPRGCCFMHRILIVEFYAQSRCNVVNVYNTHCVTTLHLQCWFLAKAPVKSDKHRLKLVDSSLIIKCDVSLVYSYKYYQALR